MEDKVIDELLNTKLWKIWPNRSCDNPNKFRIYSNMKGFLDGRYSMDITKLKRKSEGNIYKISMYWTPYNPDNLVFKGRFNSFEELTAIIGSVNKDLLDEGRILNFNYM